MKIANYFMTLALMATMAQAAFANANDDECFPAMIEGVSGKRDNMTFLSYVKLVSQNGEGQFPIDSVIPGFSMTRFNNDMSLQENRCVYDDSKVYVGIACIQKSWIGFRFGYLYDMKCYDRESVGTEQFIQEESARLEEALKKRQ